MAESNSKKATLDTLSELHNKLTQQFIEMLEKGVECTAVVGKGEDARVETYWRKANASELNVIRQMLKDNGVEADLANSKPLQDVLDRLPFEGEDQVNLFRGQGGTPIAH